MYISISTRIQILDIQTHTHTLILILLLVMVVVSILCKQCGWQIGGEGYISRPPSVLWGCIDDKNPITNSIACSVLFTLVPLAAVYILYTLVYLYNMILYYCTYI